MIKMIKKDKKTAWQASYWDGDSEREVTDWTVTLPDGRMVAVELPPNAQPGLSLSLTLD